jgi:hypothetical protein
VCDRLVLADRTIEDDAFLRITCRHLERATTDADRFRRDHDALRIQAIEQVVEATAHLADHVRG